MRVAAVAHPGGEGNVDLRAFARALTGLLERSGPRIPVLLVQGAEDDGRVAIEDFLRAVPMVDVPVQNEYASQAVRFQGMACGQRCVVEQAKPSAFPGRRVMAGRTDE